MQPFHSLVIDDLDITDPCDREMLLLQCAKLHLKGTGNDSDAPAIRKSKLQRSLALETPMITVSSADDDSDCHEYIPVVYEDETTTDGASTSNEELAEFEELSSSDDDAEEEEEPDREEVEEKGQQQQQQQQQAEEEVRNQDPCLVEAKLKTNEMRHRTGKALV